MTVVLNGTELGRGRFRIIARTCSVASFALWDDWMTRRGLGLDFFWKRWRWHASAWRIALGLDRIVMISCGGRRSLREVIPSQDGAGGGFDGGCAYTGGEKQLRELESW